MHTVQVLVIFLDNNVSYSIKLGKNISIFGGFTEIVLNLFLSYILFKHSFVALFQMSTVVNF